MNVYPGAYIVSCGQRRIGRWVEPLRYEWREDEHRVSIGYDPTVANLDPSIILPFANREHQEGDIIVLGDLCLRIIEICSSDHSYLAVCAGWRGRLRVAWHGLLRWLDDACRRLVVTAEIWGLAKCDPAIVPTWRDLKVFKSKKAK